MSDKSLTENKELNFITQIIDTAFFGKSRLKNIVGIVFVFVLLSATYVLSLIVSQEPTIRSSEALLFIFMCALTNSKFHGFLLQSWLRELEPTQIETPSERVSEIQEKCKKRNQYFRNLSFFIFSLALAIDLGLKSKFPIYMQLVKEHPSIWLIPAIIIFTHMLINTGQVVEMMRLENFASHQEKIKNVTSKMKFYYHQLPELLEDFICARMIQGYAIGTCITMYLIS